MQSTSTGYTIAEFCEQYNNRQIVINREYQRTDKVWPPSARSFLIDTILDGYPIPKIFLSQITDVLSKKTRKEVVDGQQRTNAIVDFFHDKLRITKGKYEGKTFSTLDEEEKTKFLTYTISADIFSSATNDDIREVFRRINSYQVPLNPQESWYATFQGEFKWFIADLSKNYAEALKNLGVVSERQISRMVDGHLLTECVQVLLIGIESSSQAKLKALYKQYNSAFAQKEEISDIVSETMECILSLLSIHKTPLMTRYNFYSLFSAIAHAKRRLDHLNDIFDFRNLRPLSDVDQVNTNLTALADALEADETGGPFAEFVRACSAATNRLPQRTTRFQWLCKALLPDEIR